jgi:hypothetical protein
MLSGVCLDELCLVYFVILATFYVYIYILHSNGRATDVLTIKQFK